MRCPVSAFNRTGSRLDPPGPGWRLDLVLPGGHVGELWLVGLSAAKLEQAVRLADADSGARWAAALARPTVRGDHAAVWGKLAAAVIGVASRESRTDAGHSVRTGVEAMVSRCMRIEALGGASQGDCDQHEPSMGCSHRPSFDRDATRPQQ